MKGSNSVARACALAVSLAACSLDVEGPPAGSLVVLGPGQLDAPVLQSAAVDEEGLLTVTWTAPPGAETVVIEVARNGGWGGSGTFPAAAGQGRYVMYPAEEGAELAVRARAESLTASSAPSNALSVTVPLRPAQSLSVSALSDGRFWVSGWCRSAASTLRYERRVVTADGALGPWNAAAVTTIAGLPSDGDLSAWVDGARYRYRAFCAKGGAESRPVEADGPVAPPLAPTVSASLVGSAVRLSWSYAGVAPVNARLTVRSAAAPSWQEPLETREGLPASGELYLASAGGGLWTYGVAAVVAAPSSWAPNATVASPVATAELIVPHASWAGTLAARVVEAPRAHRAARDPQGRLALLFEDGSTKRLYLPADLGGWTEKDLPAGATVVKNGLAYAADGTLHLILAELLSPSWTIRHWTLAAGAWSYEVVGSVANWGDHACSAALDPAGAPQVLCRDDVSGGPRLRWFARATDGSWSSEVPPGALSARQPVGSLAVGGDGAPSLLVRDALGATTLLSRRGAAWAEWPLPAMPSGGSSAWDLEALGGPGAAVRVLHLRPSAVSGMDLLAAAHDGAAWGAAESVMPRTPATSGFSTGSSLDGSRAVVAANGFMAWDGAAGWKSATLLYPRLSYSPRHAAGIHAGKAWVLTGLTESYASPGPERYLLHEEQ